MCASVGCILTGLGKEVFKILLAVNIRHFCKASAEWKLLCRDATCSDICLYTYACTDVRIHVGRMHVGMYCMHACNVGTYSCMEVRMHACLHVSVAPGSRSILQQDSHSCPGRALLQQDTRAQEGLLVQAPESPRKHSHTMVSKPPIVFGLAARM